MVLSYPAFLTISHLKDHEIMTVRVRRTEAQHNLAVVALLSAALSCGSPPSRLDNVNGTGDTTGNAGGTGGMIATGGMFSTGGTPATGGMVAMGGMMATGGVIATGGAGGMFAMNGAPSVNAGADPGGQVFIGTSVDLNGSVSDDGLPEPSKVTILWSKASGAGSVVFEATNAAVTKATFSAEGTYVLRLTANDGALQAHDDVTVNVLPLTTGLSAYFKFNEGSGTTTKDEQVALSGSLSGVGWAPGKEGSSLNCSGATDMVSVPNTAAIDLGAGDFTVTAWFKSTQKAAADVYPELVFKNQDLASGSRRFEIFLNNPTGLPSDLIFKLWDGTSTDNVATPAPLDGNWHHVVGRRRGNQLAVFLDGVSKASKTIALGSAANTGPLNFCGVGQSWANYDGQIDNVRLFARALEDAEVAWLSANGQ